MEARATAGAAVPENTQDLELRTFTTSREIEASYKLGCFLTIQQIDFILKKKPKLTDSEDKMRKTIDYVSSHHFPHTQVPLPVSSLQHVTEEAALYGIVGQECFRITKTSEKRPEFHDLIFWSAGISPPDIEKARQEMYEAVRGVISPGVSRTFREEINKQFATSPAFNKYFSRYGNFRFSFPVSELLDLYKAQYCDGGEPQLRILGTEVYKQEIAHYIVVHSPTASKYGHLPMVPTIQTRRRSSESLPFVYQDGVTLYWRPESTSEALKVKISADGCVRKECFMPCDDFQRDNYCDHLKNGTYSVWNHLIFAFHLPYRGQLDIHRDQLLENLTSCKAVIKPYLGKCRLTREEAEDVIWRLRQ